jgi:PAS domain S-box-containing protein
MSDEPIEIARQRERALLEEEGIYRQILDAIADMVLVKGAHSRILWANKAFRDYYGMTNEELQELVDAPFNAPDNTQQYVADDRLVFTTGKTLEIPMERVTRHDGVVGLFHTVKSPIRDDDGQVRMTVGVSRNVAETVELREELLRARAQLERRSEERRVGKECRRLCRSRWSPYH